MCFDYYYRQHISGAHDIDLNRKQKDFHFFMCLYPHTTAIFHWFFTVLSRAFLHMQNHKKCVKSIKCYGFTTFFLCSFFFFLLLFASFTEYKSKLLLRCMQLQGIAKFDRCKQWGRFATKTHRKKINEKKSHSLEMQVHNERELN